MNHQEVLACKKLPDHSSCKGNLPSNKIAKSRTCKGELLLNPTLSTFKICDIQGSYKNQSDWKLIETVSGLLYSLEKPALVTVACLSQPNNQTELKGTGIIQLASGCDLRIREKTLLGVINYGKREQLKSSTSHRSIKISQS